MYPEDELASFYQHPQCAVMSDATALSLDGPLGDDIFYGAFTWASWFLRHIVRERKALSLPEAIRKVTSLPVQRIGIGDRGLLKLGARCRPCGVQSGVCLRVRDARIPQPAGPGHSARDRERRCGVARRRRDRGTCWNRADAGLTGESRIPTRRLQVMNNEELVRAFLDEAITGHDLKAFDRFCHPGYRWHPSSEEQTGTFELDAFKGACGVLFDAFPDLEVHILDLVGNADRLAVRVCETGTHLGCYMGLPPTGKRVRWDTLIVYRVDGGLLVEEWSVGDYLSLLLHLGAVAPVDGVTL